MSLFGKYKSVVLDVDDEDKGGKIRVSCPEVFGEGDMSGWCTPCVNVAGDSFGDFCLPRVGDFVWLEFEKGDVDKPIYSGGWFSAGKTPLTNYGEEERVISFEDVKLTFKNGTLTISAGGSSIALNASMINKLRSIQPCSHPDS